MINPIPHETMEALRVALTEQHPDTIAVVALSGSPEAGYLGMWVSSKVGEEETAALLFHAITTAVRVDG